MYSFGATSHGRGRATKTKGNRHKANVILGSVTPGNIAPPTRKARRASKRFYIGGKVVSKALVSHTKKVIGGITEGRLASDIKVDTLHPKIIRLLNSISEVHRERGHQAIIDAIQTLANLEVAEWAPLPQGRKPIPCLIQGGPIYNGDVAEIIVSIIK
jgi:hypothetical protein